MVCGRIPSRAAVSRSMVSVSFRPEDIASLVTSRSSGRVRSCCTTLGPHSASSAGFASSSVYWNCVRLVRVSIWRSCTGWRKSWTPSTSATRGCRRAMISAALALRWLRGLRVMLRRPLLVVGLVPAAPMKEASAWTSGACSTTSASARCRATIRRHEAPGDPSSLPRIRPVAGGERERERLPIEHPARPAVVQTPEPFPLPLRPPVETRLLRFVVRLEQVRAHHRGQGEREDRRHADGDGERDGELAEEPADDAAHEEERDQHRDQGHRQRDDGEPDLLRALERRLEGRIALLDVPRDVLDHDDGL